MQCNPTPRAPTALSRCPAGFAILQPFTTRRRDVVGMFVTFHFDTGFDAAAISGIAEGARSKFAGMPGLRSKTFTLDEERQIATNFDIWDDPERAHAFFTEQMLDGVTKVYGVRPTVEYVEIAALVDNAR